MTLNSSSNFNSKVKATFYLPKTQLNSSEYKQTLHVDILLSDKTNLKKERTIGGTQLGAEIRSAVLLSHPGISVQRMQHFPSLSKPQGLNLFSNLMIIRIGKISVYLLSSIFNKVWREKCTRENSNTLLISILFSLIILVSSTNARPRMLY